MFVLRICLFGLALKLGCIRRHSFSDKGAVDAGRGSYPFCMMSPPRFSSICTRLSIETPVSPSWTFGPRSTTC